MRVPVTFESKTLMLTLLDLFGCSAVVVKKETELRGRERERDRERERERDREHGLYS